MSTLPIFTSFIAKLVRTISLNRVLVWSFTALMAIAFYTVYENRTKLLSFISSPAPTNMVGLTFEVGKTTRDQLKNIVEGEQRIVGISVVSTDLRLNEARTLYFFGDEIVVSNVFDRTMQAGSGRLPLFTNNDESNSQIIKLINGQFTCVGFTKTLVSKIYPELGDSIKSICRSSIPSYYGYFSGYVEVYVSESPSVERELQYKLFVEKLANDIYFRDVLETQKPEKIVRKMDSP